MSLSNLATTEDHKCCEYLCVPDGSLPLTNTVYAIIGAGVYGVISLLFIYVV